MFGNPTKIKAIIFDLDGVIADSEHISAKADVTVLSKLGIVMTEEEKTRAFGRRTEEIYGDVLRERKLTMNMERLVREKNRVFIGLIKGNLRPLKDSVELVKFFIEKGFKVALATSSHVEKMTSELRELGIENLFEIKVTGDDVYKGKPDPEMFLKAAGRLGVKPGECAVIEDSAFGVQAAKNAGMFAIAFRSPNSREQDISGADMVVDDLDSVRTRFGKEA